MSKSANMLRTRRRDNNCKPNRRLDRKSSRGMIYENEELRLKTININAEIERGQSDIKKLRRENEQLRKEIWCLRDEYEKLDKLLKDKENCSSCSSTTCASDSESCSSCTEELETVETSQNLENVQKTNLKNLHTQFDHLSVVPEENSAENSDKNSTRASIPIENWNDIAENDVIQPDQSYPITAAHEKIPKHFFSPIKTSKSHEGMHTNNRYCSVDQNNQLQTANFHDKFLLAPKFENTQILSKSSTDLIVKTDNQSFSTARSGSTFSNGGNLDDLLNDIECISQDILKISLPNVYSSGNTNFNVPNHESNDILAHIQNCDLSYVPTAKVDNFEFIENDSSAKDDEKPYKSELNVILMPTPMPLIGFDKYSNMQGSCDSINTKSFDDPSASYQNLRIIPNDVDQNVISTPKMFRREFPRIRSNQNSPFVPVTPNFVNIPNTMDNDNTNPFFFGNLKDTYENSDIFSSRYNPDTFCNQETGNENGEKTCDSQPKLLDIDPSSENEENLKFKTTKIESDQSATRKGENDNNESAKSPKLSIRRKVSIHFKGKKDKNAKNKVAEVPDTPKSADKSKKNSIFDIKFLEAKQDKKEQNSGSATPVMKSASTLSIENKNSVKAKNSNSEKETPVVERKLSLPTPDVKKNDRKGRKSLSISPERKHVHLREDGKKRHKKHRPNKAEVERYRFRRSTISTDRLNRERSFSICTDRSGILDRRLGLGFSMYEDASDRERTNSISSCESIKTRKLSNISNFHISGKIPWCGCWGNGCI